MAKAKSLYEAINPQTRRGYDRSQASGHGAHLKAQSFTSRAAAASGQSERGIDR